MELAGLAVAAFLFQVPDVHKRTVVSTDDVGRYEGQYGIPIYWSLSLIVGPTGQELPPPSTSIRTRGIFSALPKRDRPDVKLCLEGTNRCLSLATPAPEIRDAFFFEALFRDGHEAQVVGAFAEGGFLFWSFDSAPPSEGTDASARRTIEHLILRPDTFVGRIVTVRGRFRGANLFGDYAPETRRAATDWVIRDGPFSIWVTGAPPKDKTWRLDPASRSECVWWVEVEGQVERHRETLYLRARQVHLLNQDSDSSCASDAPR